MPPKKERLLTIKDEEHFLSLYNEHHKKLMVVDVHQGWCGPCEMMNPTYEALSNLIDDFEKRMDFVMEGKIVDEVHGANIPELTEKVYKYIPFYSA